MPDLARTLRAIAEDGADVLYKGSLARAIAEDIRSMRGYLNADDLAEVRPREVEPLVIGYREQNIYVLPELNGGPTLWVAFEDLKKRRQQPEAKPNATTFTAYAAAMRAAWKDRFTRLGDAGERTAPTSTTHLCVVDRDGNMVTLTQTLLSLFGARIILPQTGILMNNGINWFDPVPGGPNSIAPDRVALANYVPSVMTGQGHCHGNRRLRRPAHPTCRVPAARHASRLWPRPGAIVPRPAHGCLRAGRGGGGPAHAGGNHRGAGG